MNRRVVNHNENMMVRIAENIKEKAIVKASRNGQTLSEYVRMLILQDLGDMVNGN